MRGRVRWLSGPSNAPRPRLGMLARIAAVFALSLTPVQYRGGAQTAHAHGALQLWADAARGSTHHQGPARAVAPAAGLPGRTLIDRAQPAVASADSFLDAAGPWGDAGTFGSTDSPDPVETVDVAGDIGGGRGLVATLTNAPLVSLPRAGMMWPEAAPLPGLRPAPPVKPPR